MKIRPTNYIVVESRDGKRCDILRKVGYDRYTCPDNTEVSFKALILAFKHYDKIHLVDTDDELLFIRSRIEVRKELLK